MTQVSEALWANFPQAYLMIFGGLLVVLLIALAARHRSGDHRPHAETHDSPCRSGHGDGQRAAGTGASVDAVARNSQRQLRVRRRQSTRRCLVRGERGRDSSRIIGPNGAGKTTLFNVISGLLRPPQGDVFLDGQIARQAARRIASRDSGIGRTNQIVRPFGRLTVVDNVAVGALVHERSLRGARAAAREIVEFVGLGALADRNAGTLTLTQRKRLEVARALALKPRAAAARRSDGRA